MEPNKSILIVEDEVHIAEVIESYLKKAGYNTVCAYDGAAALKVFKNAHFALVLLDLMLPRLSGEEVCKQLREISNVPIMMLTAKVEEVDILKGLQIGADDYMTKPFSPRQMVARVAALLRRAEGKRYAVSSVLSFNNGLLTMDTEAQEVRKNGRVIDLTPKEYKLLLAMAKAPNKVFTREALIKLAYDSDFEGFDRAVDSHIKNLRKKLEHDSDDHRYIVTVRGTGYKFGGE